MTVRTQVGIVGAVLMSGMWKPGIAFEVFGTDVALQGIVREGLLIALALGSLALTPRAVPICVASLICKSRMRRYQSSLPAGHVV